MEKLILLIIGVLSGWYIYKKMFKIDGCKGCCGSCSSSSSGNFDNLQNDGLNKNKEGG